MRVKQHVNVEDNASALMIRRNVGSCHVDLCSGGAESRARPHGENEEAKSLT